MTIESSVIFSDRSFAVDQKKIVERHTDHLGVNYDISYVADIGFDEQASLDANAIIVNQQTIDNEIANGIAECYAGNDPLNITPFNPITPDYQTWDELMFGISIHFLSQSNQLELQWWALSNDSISSTDKKRVWDMSQSEVSDVNGDVQIAIDTQASLDLYASYFNEDGSKP